MITHEQAKISVLTVEGLLRNCFDDTIELTTLKNYIKQQEKKDKLLELYRKVYDSSYGEATAMANVDLKALLETNKKHREIFRQIRLLEEELNK